MIAYWKVKVITRSKRSAWYMKSLWIKSKYVALVKSFWLLFSLWRCHAWISLKRQPHRKRKNIEWKRQWIVWELEEYTRSDGVTKKSLKNATIYANPPFRLLNKNGWNNMTKSGGGSDIDKDAGREKMTGAKKKFGKILWKFIS